MKGLVFILAATNLSGCNPCSGRKSPEMNRNYYIPPARRVWEMPQGESKESCSSSHMTSSFVYRGTARREGEPALRSLGEVGCDGGRPYVQELPSRRRSSSATTTMSNSSSSDIAQDLDSLPGVLSGVALAKPGPTTLCDRLRLSLAGICTGSRWVWVPSSSGTAPLRRVGSFRDDEQPGLRSRTQVIDTRKRVLTLPLDDVLQNSPSMYPYKSEAGSGQMISIPGNNKPYAAKKRYKKAKQ